MNDKIVSLQQHQQFEDKLRFDAEKLDSDVSPQLKAELMRQLACQKVQPVKQSDTTHFYSVTRNKFAIAASLVLTVLAVQLFINKEPATDVESFAIEETVIEKPATQHSQINIDLNKRLDSKKLIASNHLGKEYSAILADMEKIKARIAQL